MKNLLKNLLKKIGYQIVKINENNIYNLQTYTNKEGKFDYNKYKSIQIKGNIEKINNIWVLEKNIEFLSEYIIQLGLKPNFGICHGSRRGNEQKWFSRYLNCEVIGTEISETATDFENTIQWDFHKIKEEWINSVDFIYSNSFDHSYNPEECLNSWMSCISPNGICIIEHTNLHDANHTNELDPFGASIEIMPYLITKWAKNKYFVKEILDAPLKKDNTSYLKFIIIQKK